MKSVESSNEKEIFPTKNFFEDFHGQNERKINCAEKIVNKNSFVQIDHCVNGIMSNGDDEN